MDPLLLQYYNEELTYMRASAGEFANLHPKIAKRLGMHGIEVADPFVERMIEAFCFMSARTRIKLDAEFPRFTQRLLEVVYPNYISPTPSMSVAQFNPSRTEGDLSKGFLVPKNTVLYGKVPDGEVSACEFHSSQDVMLWPVELIDAKLGGVPPDIPNLERYLPASVKVASSLRLRLRTTGGIKFCDIDGLDHLPVYLQGDEALASHLFELLHAGTVASFIGIPKNIGKKPHVVTHRAIVHVGMEPSESLLPQAWNTPHGHNLLHEYFACPSRFYFFSMQSLAQGLKRIDGNEAEIVLVLTKSTNSLNGLVDEKQFALFCTPIINLFSKHTDRLELNTRQTEFHIIPDRSRPMDFEVYSVDSLSAQQSNNSGAIEFRPLYQTLNQDEGNHGRYFSLRREPRLTSDFERKYGTRTFYIGSEVFVSLVDQHEAPYPDTLRYLSIQAMLTNRDLPRLIPRNGVDDLYSSESLPVNSIGLVRPMSPPKPAFAQREHAWRLIRQLSFNYLPLTDMPHRDGAKALRDMLRLFVTSDDHVMSKQIQGLIGSKIEPVIRRLPGNGPLIYGRGVQCTLTVDENNFSGISPYLFGLIMERYLARQVAINMFTETRLLTMQRGEITKWPVRIGSRNVV